MARGIQMKDHKPFALSVSTGSTERKMGADR